MTSIVNFLTQLVASKDTGNVSHTKMWANVAMLIGACIIVAKAIAGNLSDDLLIQYLLLCTVTATASKTVSVIGNKKGDGNDNSTDS